MTLRGRLRPCRRGERWLQGYGQVDRCHDPRSPHRFALGPRTENGIVSIRQIERSRRPGARAVLCRAVGRESPDAPVRIGRRAEPPAVRVVLTPERPSRGVRGHRPRPRAGRRADRRPSLPEPAGGPVAEVAIAVADAVQQQGVGRRLMEAGVRWARARDSRRYGLVLHRERTIRLLSGLGWPSHTRDAGIGHRRRDDDSGRRPRLDAGTRPDRRPGLSRPRAAPPSHGRGPSPTGRRRASPRDPRREAVDVARLHVSGRLLDRVSRVTVRTGRLMMWRALAGPVGPQLLGGADAQGVGLAHETHQVAAPVDDGHAADPGAGAGRLRCSATDVSGHTTMGSGDMSAPTVAG